METKVGIQDYEYGLTYILKDKAKELGELSQVMHDDLR